MLNIRRIMFNQLSNNIHIESHIIVADSLQKDDSILKPWEGYIFNLENKTGLYGFSVDERLKNDLLIHYIYSPHHVYFQIIDLLINRFYEVIYQRTDSVIKSAIYAYILSQRQ